MTVLDYLKQVAKTQKELLILENSIDAIDQEYSKLGVKYQLRKPNSDNPEEKAGVFYKIFAFSVDFIVSLVYWVGATLCFSLLVGIFLAIFYFFFDFRLPILQDDPFGRFVLTDISIAGFLAFFYVLSENKEKKMKARQEWNDYNNEVHSQEIRVKSENIIKQSMQMERRRLADEYSNTKTILSRLYERL